MQLSRYLSYNATDSLQHLKYSSFIHYRSAVWISK